MKEGVAGLLEEGQVSTKKEGETDSQRNRDGL